jgi:hypothetical protein
LTSAAGRLLTAQYRAGQVGLKAQMVRDAQRLWAVWKGTSKEEWDLMVSLAVPLIQARYRVSAGSSARYFETLSALETGRKLPAALPAPLDEGFIANTLAATALVSVYNGRRAGLTMAAAKQVGFVRMAGSASRLALMGGREAITGAARAAKVGYERITSGAACEFCAGLEGEHSSAEAFPAHDHCSCVAAPTF